MKKSDKKELRKFAIIVLDDEHGIRQDAYDVLAGLLKDNGSKDILQYVDAGNDRAYIGEDVAEELLRDISKWDEADNVHNEEKVEHKVVVAPEPTPEPEPEPAPKPNDALQSLIEKAKDTEE